MYVYVHLSEYWKIKYDIFSNKWLVIELNKGYKMAGF